MFRASDIYGARAGPQGPAAAAASQRAPALAAPPQQSWSGGGYGGGGGPSASWPGAGGGGYGAGGGGYGNDSRYSPYGGGKGGGDFGGGFGGFGGGKGMKGKSYQGPPPAARAPTRPNMPQVATPQPTPNTVTVLGSGGLPQGCEKDIEEKVREVCIEHGLSIADEVRYVSASVAYIDFPYQEVCHEFMKATGGTLKMRTRSYKLQASGYNSSSSGPGVEAVAADGTVLDHPTDQLMVRHIGDMDEEQLMAAFVSVVPLVKSVRILTDRRTGKSKGFGFVVFWSISDAETAMSRINAAGGMVGGRKAAISYAKPMTQEEALEGEVSYRNEQTEIKAQAQSALGGINADMWANYLQFHDEKAEKETMALIQAKKAKLQAAADAKEAERLRIERAENEKAFDDEDSWGDHGGAPPVPLNTALALPPGSAAALRLEHNSSPLPLQDTRPPQPSGSWSNPLGGAAIPPPLSMGGLGSPPGMPLGGLPGLPMRPMGGPSPGFAGLAGLAKPS